MNNWHFTGAGSGGRYGGVMSKEVETTFTEEEVEISFKNPAEVCAYEDASYEMQCLLFRVAEQRDKYRRALETLGQLAKDSLDINMSYQLTATDVLSLVELELKEAGDE